MEKNIVEKRALVLLRTFEAAGVSVSRVTIEGRKIALDLVDRDSRDEFDLIDMRHDKT